jgi:hypothetical protein
MPTATLKPVKRAAKGHNRFCGPAALSIIAGVDTAEAAAVIRQVSRKRNVMGTSNWEILRSLNLLGFKASSAAKVDPLNRKKNPTLASWLDGDERDGQSLYLIAAGYHWQVVQGRRFCCGITKDIVSTRDAKVKRRARISGVWKIEGVRKVALADVLPAKPKRDTSDDAAQAKAKRLAKQYDIKIEVDTYGHGPERHVTIIVWGPTWAPHLDEETVDPFYDNHFTYDWREALELVEEYVKLITANPELVA